MGVGLVRGQREADARDDGIGEGVEHAIADIAARERGLPIAVMTMGPFSTISQAASGPVAASNREPNEARGATSQRTA